MINKILKNPRLGVPQLGKVTPKLINDILEYQIPITLVDESTIKWNLRKGYNAKVTLAGSRTLQLEQLTPGDYGTLEVIQGGSGAYTLTLPSNSKVAGGGSGAIALTADIGAIDIIAFYYNGTTLYWNVQTNFT